MPGFGYAFGSLICVSLVSFAGALLMLVVKKNRFDAAYLPLYVFAFGTFVGNAFFFLLPESFIHLSETLYLILAVASGFAVLMLSDVILSRLRKHKQNKNITNLAFFTLWADALHSWTDGSVIAVSYMIDLQLGLTTTLAVISHEIPHEIAKFGILLNQGVSPFRALKLGFLPSLGLFWGAGMIYLTDRYYSFNNYYLLPFTAGCFIYISAIKMIPILYKSLRQGVSDRKKAGMVLALALSLISIFFLQQWAGHSH